MPDFEKFHVTGENKKPTHHVDYSAVGARLGEIRNLEDEEKPSAKDLESSLENSQQARELAEQYEYFGHPENPEIALKVLGEMIAQNRALGLTIPSLSEKKIAQIKSEIALYSKDRERSQDADTKEDFKERLAKLQQGDLPLSETLQILKSEFAGTLDEETTAVIDRFSSLLSEEVITDPKEREAVEVLLQTQEITAFTAVSFTGFVQTLYQEPTLSEETKERIEKKFGIPRISVHSGAELAHWTLKKDENGDYLHNSPDTALEFRAGVKTHVDDSGNTLLTLEGNERTAPIPVSPEMLQNGESIARLANYALIRKEIYQELNQLTNLFGGGSESVLGVPPEESITKANRFARLLIGRRSPDSILSRDDLATFRQALRALHDPAQTDEDTSISSLERLGVLSGGKFQWERIDQIGRILRENRNFQTFEMTRTGEAHRLLVTELARHSGHGQNNQTSIGNLMHAIDRTVHERGIRIGWFFKVTLPVKPIPLCIHR